MQLPNRLGQAINKLYTAFYDDTLNPLCSFNCAAGNITDKNDHWKHFSDDHGSLKLNYIGKVHETLGRKINGYLPSEILKIEATFLKAYGFKIPLRKSILEKQEIEDKENKFKALVAVIEYLCKIEEITNVLEIEALFKREVIVLKDKALLVNTCL